MREADIQTESMCEKFFGLTEENKLFTLDFSKQLLQVQQIFLQAQGISLDGCKIAAGNYLPAGKK
jgi:hypothetical protein